MRAYSQAVRQQVLRAVDEGVCRAQIIERFEVSPATIKRYLKQRRETGNVLPRPIAGRPPRKKAAWQGGVQELLEAHPEASQPRVLPLVGGGAWHSGEPSFHESGHSCTWMDTPQRKAPSSERRIKQEWVSVPKVFKQALERTGWGLLGPRCPLAPEQDPGLQPGAYRSPCPRPGHRWPLVFFRADVFPPFLLPEQEHLGLGGRPVQVACPLLSSCWKREGSHDSSKRRRRSTRVANAVASLCRCAPDTGTSRAHA